MEIEFINIFPNEVFYIIFNFVCAVHDLKSVELTCNFFRSLICDWMQRNLNANGCFLNFIKAKNLEIIQAKICQNYPNLRILYQDQQNYPLLINDTDNATQIFKDQNYIFYNDKSKWLILKTIDQSQSEKVFENTYIIQKNKLLLSNRTFYTKLKQKIKHFYFFGDDKVWIKPDMKNSVYFLGFSKYNQNQSRNTLQITQKIENSLSIVQAHRKNELIFKFTLIFPGYQYHFTDYKLLKILVNFEKKHYTIGKTWEICSNEPIDISNCHRISKEFFLSYLENPKKSILMRRSRVFGVENLLSLEFLDSHEIPQ